MQAYAVYRTQHIAGAQPVELIVLLLQAARKHVQEAQKAIIDGAIEKANDALVRAQDIIYELRGAVNRDAGKLADDLIALYDFILSGLLDANLRKRTDRLDVILEILAVQAGAWRELTTRM